MLISNPGSIGSRSLNIWILRFICCYIFICIWWLPCQNLSSLFHFSTHISQFQSCPLLPGMICCYLLIKNSCYCLFLTFFLYLFYELLYHETHLLLSLKINILRAKCALSYLWDSLFRCLITLNIIKALAIIIS